MVARARSSVARWETGAVFLLRLLMPHMPTEDTATPRITASTGRRAEHSEKDGDRKHVHVPVEDAIYHLHAVELERRQFPLSDPVRMSPVFTSSKYPQGDPLQNAAYADSLLDGNFVADALLQNGHFKYVNTNRRTMNPAMAERESQIASSPKGGLPSGEPRIRAM